MKPDSKPALAPALAEVSVVALWSIKGGSGKSTLAVLSAWALARKGARVLVLDVDLTGTSLADGLDLCAPRLPIRDDSSLDLAAAPSGELMSRQQTLEARDKRQVRDPQAPRAVCLPYLNDAMQHVPQAGGEGHGECRMDALGWHWAQADPPTDSGGLIRVLPSSPQRTDMAVAVYWLKREDDHSWASRLQDLLELAAGQIPGLTHIIIDLPPGPMGLASTTVRMVQRISGQRSPLQTPAGREVIWRSRPFLVTTPDRNDLFIAAEFYQDNKIAMPGLALVVNKASPALVVERRLLQVRFPTLALAGFQGINSIAEHPQGLGQVFRGNFSFPGPLMADRLTSIFGEP